MKPSEALRSREWCGISRSLVGGWYCLTCGQFEPNHAPDCPYAAAIKEAEEIEARVISEAKDVDHLTEWADVVEKLLADCLDALIEYQNLLESQGWTRHQADEINEVKALIERVRGMVG